MPRPSRLFASVIAIAWLFLVNHAVSQPTRRVAEVSKASPNGALGLSQLLEKLHPTPQDLKSFNKVTRGKLTRSTQRNTPKKSPAVSQTAFAQVAKLQQCYKIPELQPGTAFKTTLQFIVTREGSTAKAKAHTLPSFDHPDMSSFEKCLTNSIKSWHFAMRSKPLVVNYPIVFRQE